MNKIHEKISPCCQAKVYKFGGKRRQCSLCKKTWTLWPKKRGRRSLRPRHNLLEKVVAGKQSLILRQSKRDHLTVAALSARLRRTMENFLKRRQANTLPSGPLILVIDALWFRFKDQRWTMYLMAVRSICRDKAVILDPRLIIDRENHSDWSRVVDGIPRKTRNRIKALVCDGFRGSDRIAKSNSWIIQRCHFHLLAQMQVNRGKWKQLSDSPQREAVYTAIRKALIAKSVNLPRCIKQLNELLLKNDCPRRIGAIGREFLRRLNQFRAYQNFPELRLPNTTNSIESLNKIIRSRCRHLRTPKSLLLRSRVIIRIRKTVTCKPKIFNRIN